MLRHVHSSPSMSRRERGLGHLGGGRMLFWQLSHEICIEYSEVKAGARRPPAQASGFHFSSRLFEEGDEKEKNLDGRCENSTTA